MRCEEVRAHFADYLIDDLVEPHHSKVEQHLTSCEVCASEAEELKLVWAQLGSIPAEHPTLAMRARFEAMLEAYKQGLTQQTTTCWRGMNSWISKWWPTQPVLQLSVSLALLALGLVIGLRYHQSNEEPNSEITQLRSEVREMRQLVVLSLMQQHSASERLRGVSWTYQIQQPDNEVLTALLDTLKHDASVNVRLAAIDALLQFGEMQIVREGVLQAMTEQTSPLVQIALIDIMVALREKESVETLRRMAVDESLSEAVRKRALWGLEQLA